MDPANLLPSVTLAEVINYIQDENVFQKDSFSTGSKNVDSLMGASGINRGSIVEISGPPGSGKTSVGLCLCNDAIRARNRVLWVSTTHCKPPLSRLNQMKGYSNESLEYLSFINFTSLSQLIIYFQNQQNNSKNALIIIEDIYYLFASSIGTPNHNRQEDQRRKIRTTNYVIDTIYKYSRRNNTAVLILSSMITRSGNEDILPKLIPGLGYGSWQKLINRRIVLYRDNVIGTTPKLYAKSENEIVEFKITEKGIEDAEILEGGGLLELDFELTADELSFLEADSEMEAAEEEGVGGEIEVEKEEGIEVEEGVEVVEEGEAEEDDIERERPKSMLVIPVIEKLEPAVEPETIKALNLVKEHLESRELAPHTTTVATEIIQKDTIEESRWKRQTDTPEYNEAASASVSTPPQPVAAPSTKPVAKPPASASASASVPASTPAPAPASAPAPAPASAPASASPSPITPKNLSINIHSSQDIPSSPYISPPLKKQKIFIDEIPNSQPEWSDSEIIML